MFAAQPMDAAQLERYQRTRVDEKIRDLGDFADQKPPATMPYLAPQAPMMAPMQMPGTMGMMGANVKTVQWAPPTSYIGGNVAPVHVYAQADYQQVPVQQQAQSYYVSQPRTISYAPQVYTDFVTQPGHMAPPKEEKYELPDAWQLYPCGPWNVWWSGHVPIHGEYARHANHGVALNEMVVIPQEKFGQEYAPYDSSVRNIYWQKIGSCGVPEEHVPDPEGKRRNMARTIRELPGLAPAYDFKGMHDPHKHYNRMNKYRKEKALYPEKKLKEKSIEIFDDEALAELFSDPEALLEREFKIDVAGD